MGEDEVNISRLISMQKAVIWEESKGKLRALYMVNGMTDSENKHHVQWDKVKKRVEEFIKAFEEDGLHE